MALFGKDKMCEGEKVLKMVLDAQGADVVVVREKDGEFLYINKAARERLDRVFGDHIHRKSDDYKLLFNDLMEKFPPKGAKVTAYPVKHEIEDVHGRFYSVYANRTEWLEGAQCIILFLHDVVEELGINSKLYNLAYLDHLTRVPNRQKLQEDFEALSIDATGNKRCGVVSIFDLDNFKGINDTYGHNTGDVMLRRLTEHLESEPMFKGHLYRLGGDEFVLIFSESANRFANAEAIREYYTGVLSAALLSYTMPNIELSCTLSMGVSVFPQHGNNYSELLRKADIALYKAKESGRNRLVFFEEQYDKAKPFKDLYINIQPILTSAGSTYGYEMIDRGNDSNGEKNSLSLSEFDRSMDALGLGDIENDIKYFISYSKQLMVKTVQKNLPKNKFVIQVYIKRRPTPEELKQYAEMKAAGYSLCFVGVNEDTAKPDLMALAEFVKLDPEKMSETTTARFIRKHKAQKFIATHVDSSVAFEMAAKRGCAFFQGFFFVQQPAKTQKTKDIDPMKVNYLRLIKLASTDDYVDFKEISMIIATDVALSYKLLRMLNSAALGLRNQVSSIEMAVAYLGEDNLKKWVAMLALRGIVSDHPLELVRISIIRAKFVELLAPFFVPRRDPRHIFLVSLFSLLHIALEKSREELLAEIPLAPAIHLSLLTKTGPHSDLLQFHSDYEYSNWDAISKFAAKNGLTDYLISDCYIRAVKWCNDLLKGE